MRPPPPHGTVIEGRTVSFLDLFVDLAFVVLFTFVWYTWLFGTPYHDLRGSVDGRSRVYDPAIGRRFAVLLALLLVWLPTSGGSFASRTTRRWRRCPPLLRWQPHTPAASAWLLATVIFGLLSVVWAGSFVRHARLGEPFVEGADTI